jgi:hypothetical protein
MSAYFTEAVIITLIVLFFAFVVLWFFRKRVSKVNFGLFSFENDTGSLALEQISQQEHDAVLIDNYRNELDAVDFLTRKRLRYILASVFKDYIHNYPHYALIFYKARYPLSISICDNHICKYLVNDEEGYVREKVSDMLDQLSGEPIPKDIEQLLGNMAAMWIKQSIGILTTASKDKNQIYKELLGKLKRESNKEATRDRIKKNEEYLISFEHLGSSIIVSAVKPQED